MFTVVPRYLAFRGSLFHSTWTRTTSVVCKVPLLDTVNVSPSRGYHDVMGDVICPSQIMGISHLRDPRLNKGLAFTLEERQTMGIHGLLPARYKTQEEQLELCRLSLSRYQEDLNKYLYLTELQDRNEKLFFRLLTEDVEAMMPIVYTPTVGLACQKFGLIYRRPRGLFINIHDRGHIYDVIKNWPESDVRAICVTDGERILGLGDLGACGMGIPVGKLALYTALAGIKPHQCLPITLDVGTNNTHLLEDPLYIGVRQRRVSGPEYDQFVDEFMRAVVRRYGQNTLIQFEDFANHNAFRFLDRYRKQYCTFNDDIQGTAAVALAGLMAAGRVTGKKVSEHTILFLGAGEASLGIANLTVSAMVAEGLTEEQARSKIWLMDVDGLLTTGRATGMTPEKDHFAKDCEETGDLEAVINRVKPTVLIGASAASGAFTPRILKAMGTFAERPVIFALSNPTSKAECTPQQAYDSTDGRCIFSSGSPFPPVRHGGKLFQTGQGNNAYIFPGVALGVICTGMHHIDEEVFILAASELSTMVTENDVNTGSLYPPLANIRECSVRIAMRISKYGYEKGAATKYPEPSDHRSYIESQMFDYNYESSMPTTWRWPSVPEIKTRPLDPVKLQCEE